MEVLGNCLDSLRRVLVGTGAAVVIGVALALLRSSLPSALKRNPVVSLLFDAPKFPPPIAWIPFVVLAFGIRELSAYAIVFIGAVSPVLTSAYEGFESVPGVIRDSGRSLGLNGWRFCARILLPAALPRILTGARVGISMGWMSVIAAEMVSGQSGLGYSIQLNRLNLQVGSMALDMTLIGAIGFGLFELMRRIELRAIPWHERA